MKFPQYVMIKFGENNLSSALRYSGGDEYYRDGGDWELLAEFVEGVLRVSNKSDERLSHAYNLELVEITLDQWAEDNGQYSKKYLSSLKKLNRGKK